jgi:hypothetical protein
MSEAHQSLMESAKASEKVDETKIFHRLSVQRESQLSRSVSVEQIFDGYSHYVFEGQRRTVRCR